MTFSSDVDEGANEPPRPLEERLADDLRDMRLLREIAEYCARPGNGRTDCLDRILDAAIRFTRAQMGNIQLLDELGALAIVAHRGFDEPFLQFFARVDGETASVCGVSMQAAARTVVEDVTRSDVFAGQASLGTLLDAGVRAVQSTPLIGSDGTVFGMISTHFTEPHRPQERDLELMDLLARQAADYLARRRAEDALRESEVRQAFLLELSDALRPISDPVAIQAMATRLLGEHLRANRVCYVEISETESVVHQDYVSGVRSIAGRWRNADFGPAMEQALRTGHTNVVSDIRALPGLSDDERASYEAIDVAAQIVVTLFKGGTWLANFGVHSASPREWTKLEVQLTEETAERTWGAVERARAETALRQSETKYRTLFESMGQGYSAIEMIHGPDGRPIDHRLLELNPAFERLTGIRVTDAIGRTATEVTPGIDPWWFETYDRIAHQGYPERVEYEVTALGRWYEAHCFPQAASG